MASSRTSFGTFSRILNVKRPHTCKFFTKKLLLKRLPILKWLPKYSKSYAVSDFVAGFTVALTLIPQTLAYANIIGLPLQYGLYSSIMGPLIYIIFGTCKDLAVGPSAILNLISYEVVKGKGLPYAVLLCFFTGCVQILLALLKLGFLIDFVSEPVILGFTSAAALQISSTQVKNFLGINADGVTFLEIWTNVVKDIKNTNVWDVSFGTPCILFLFAMRVSIYATGFPSDFTSLGNLKLSLNRNNLNFLNRIIWFLSISRNAILVVISALIAYYLNQENEHLFKLTGDVPSGLPTPKLPPFYGYTVLKNDTVYEVTFLEMVTDLGAYILLVPIVSILEAVAICKAFEKKRSIDATQELLALGVSNLASSFFQSFPIGGALARSAINNSCDVKTTLGGMYTGMILVMALLFLTPYLYYIPKACLAAIVIMAAIYMVEVKVLKPIWKIKKWDLLPCLVTFVSCLVLPLGYGIFVGIGLNLCYILYYAARPKIAIQKVTSEDFVPYLVLTPDRCLIFPSANYLRHFLTKYSIKQALPVVIDCSHIHSADYTAATVIKSLIQDFSMRKQPLFFYNLKPSVCAMIGGLSPGEFYVFYDRSDFDSLLQRWRMTRARY